MHMCYGLEQFSLFYYNLAIKSRSLQFLAFNLSLVSSIWLQHLQKPLKFKKYASCLLLSWSVNKSSLGEERIFFYTRLTLNSVLAVKSFHKQKVWSWRRFLSSRCHFRVLAACAWRRKKAKEQKRQSSPTAQCHPKLDEMNFCLQTSRTGRTSSRCATGPTVSCQVQLIWAARRSPSPSPSSSGLKTTTASALTTNTPSCSASPTAVFSKWV